MKNPVIPALTSVLILIVGAPAAPAEEIELIVPRGFEPPPQAGPDENPMPGAYAEPPETIQAIDDAGEAIVSPVFLAQYCFGFLGTPERVAMRSAFAERALRDGDVEAAAQIAQYFVGIHLIEILCRTAGALLANGNREMAEELLDKTMEIAVPMDDWSKREFGFLLGRRLADVGRGADAVGWSYLTNLNFRWQEPLVTSWAADLFPEDTRRELWRQALGLVRASNVDFQALGFAEVGQTLAREGDTEYAERVLARAREKLGEITNPIHAPAAAVEVARLQAKLGREEEMTETIRQALNDIAVNLSGWRQTDSWRRVGRELGQDAKFDAVSEEYWKATDVLIRRLARNEGQNKVRLYELALIAALQLRADTFSPEQRETAARLVATIDGLPEPIAEDDH